MVKAEACASVSPWADVFLARHSRFFTIYFENFMLKHTRALIVDDELEIRELLTDYLADFSIACVGVRDGKSMREALGKEHFDLIILDLMLPTEDGLSLCRELRATSSIPIIMLTARGEAADKVACLEVGADDYVIKPFDPRELVARIHTILRRSHVAKEDHARVKNFGELVTFAGWTLNRSNRQLKSPENVLVPLSNSEFRLLWTFICSPRQILNRDQLLDEARGRSMDAFDRSIDILVSKLRQKLGDDPKEPKLLKTVRGEGYLLDAYIEK
jgi:two-component system OmpR family response regulator